MSTAVRILQLLPALSLVLVQVVMVGTMSPVRAMPHELVELSRMVPVSPAEVCGMKSDPAHGQDEKHCPWCQSFGQAILPEPVSLRPIIRRVLTGSAWHASTHVSAPAGLSYISRAPPV